MASKDFDPSKDSVAVNYLRVMNHVAQKGVHAGGVLGAAIVAPIVLAVNKYKGGSIQDAVPKVTTALYRTTLATTALAVAMGVARLASSPDLKAGVEDRAYRLHYNRRLNQGNLYANAGIALGGAAAVALLPASAAAVVAGGSIGAAAGLLAFVVANPAPEKKSVSATASAM